MFSITMQSEPSLIQGYLFTFLFFAAVAAVFVWWKTRCVRCNRPFAKKTLRKEKRGRGIMDSLTGTRHEFYQCKYCDHEWDKIVEVSGQ